MAPLLDYAPGTIDLLRPQLRFASVPRNETKITYEFESLTLPLLEAASIRAGKPLVVDDGHVVIPVHELQIAHIQDKFHNAIIYPKAFNLPLLAQQSLRYISSFYNMA